MPILIFIKKCFVILGKINCVEKYFQTDYSKKYNHEAATSCYLSNSEFVSSGTK
jgi:hypothetical protein